MSPYALMGRDPRDGTSLDGGYGCLLAELSGDIRGMKIGLPVDCYGEGLDGEVKARTAGTPGQRLP
mgnify:CR=1 FL=1